jgi:hypothetical protein
VTFFWQNPKLNRREKRPKPGQKIRLRVGWPEQGKGREIWRRCQVDRQDPTRCTSRETDFSIEGVQRWKKGDDHKNPGRRWKPA